MTINKALKPLFLLSVDVEDFPVILHGKETYAGNMPKLINSYLEIYRSRKAKGTFFVLGEVAQKHPDIVKMILDEGHEIGSHGHSHIPLDKHTPQTFKDDLEKSLEALFSAGAENVKGYRAPFLSINKSRIWAYEQLAAFSFTYSSSVAPGYNPLYGWPRFGKEPKKMPSGVWELPITLIPGIPVGVPVAGGIYFRVLPFWVMSYFLKIIKNRNQPIISYFHPYDLDWESESKVCAWLAKKPIGNYLIFYNRKALASRIEAALDKGFQIMPYSDYLNAYVQKTP